MLSKFTFKKVIHTGMYKSFEKDQTIIKLQKKECGYISEISWNCFAISFAIKKEPTKKDPTPFKWITLKKKASSEKEGREIIKNLSEKIQTNFDLYFFEEE